MFPIGFNYSNYLNGANVSSPQLNLGVWKSNPTNIGQIYSFNKCLQHSNAVTCGNSPTKHLQPQVQYVLRNCNFFIPKGIELEVFYYDVNGTILDLALTIPYSVQDKMYSQNEILHLIPPSQVITGGLYFTIKSNSDYNGVDEIWFDQLNIHTEVFDNIWHGIKIDCPYNASNLIVCADSKTHGLNTSIFNYSFLDNDINFITVISGNERPYANTMQLAANLTANKYYFGGVREYNYDDTNGLLINYKSFVNMHDDIRALQLVNSNNGYDDVILIGNDGGVSMSFDGGATWVNKNGPGLYINQLHGFDVDIDDPSVFLTGSQDGNNHQKGYDFISQHGNKFHYPNITGPGDGHAVEIFDQDKSKIFYTSNENVFHYGTNSTSINLTVDWKLPSSVVMKKPTITRYFLEHQRRFIVTII